MLGGAAAPPRSITAFGAFAQLQREGHVLAHRHVRVERVVLEHHGDVAVLRRHVVHHAAADRDLAAGDVLEPGDHAQQRRLAAAGRADQHDELAVRDVDAHAVQDLHGTEGFPDVADIDGRHLSPLPGPSRASVARVRPWALVFSSRPQAKRETFVSLQVMNSSSTGMPFLVFSMPRLMAGTISAGSVTRSP